MKKFTLEQYAKSVGQGAAAQALGVRQSAISKALRYGRDVTVHVNAEGAVFASETKPFPSTKKNPSKATGPDHAA